MSSCSMDNGHPDTGPADVDPLQRRIVAALKGLRFGSVEIVVHEGRIVQIERRERVRLEREFGVVRVD